MTPAILHDYLFTVVNQQYDEQIPHLFPQKNTHMTSFNANHQRKSYGLIIIRDKENVIRRMPYS